MKKIFLAVMVAVAVLGAMGAGAVFAQGSQPPSGGMMGQGGGWMHEYVVEALAAKLDMTVEQVDAALTSGKTMYQVALDAGTAEADIPALMTEVHKEAFDKAVAAGVITQTQADWMLQRMQGRTGAGYNGNCPMHNGGYAPRDGTGFRGGMMGRW